MRRGYVTPRSSPAYSGRRFPAKTRNGGLRRQSAFARARTAAAVAAPAANGELKFHDIEWNEAVADLSAGVISNTSSLVLIGQGQTESTRIGRKCTITNIGWRGEVQLILSATAAVTPAQAVRFMIVLDKQCNGAAPTVTGDGGVLESANFQSFNNLANKGRYFVLYDKTVQLNAQAAAGDGATNDTAPLKRGFTFFKKCNIPMEYSGTANPSIIDEVRTNNIFGIMIAGTSAASASLDSKFRFRFTD